MWSTNGLGNVITRRPNLIEPGRRHGCRFEAGHIGRIHLCICGAKHLQQEPHSSV